MDTVCVTMMVKFICMVEETMMMDASVMWYPMILVSSKVICCIGCTKVLPSLTTNP